MITTENISSFKNRYFLVDFQERTIRFVIWDLDECDVNAAKEQLATALNICPDFKSIEHHMKLNGYDCELEDIYTE